MYDKQDKTQTTEDGRQAVDRPPDYINGQLRGTTAP